MTLSHRSPSKPPLPRKINPLHPPHLPQNPLPLPLPQRQRQQLRQPLHQEHAPIRRRGAIMLHRRRPGADTRIADRLIIDPQDRGPVAEVEGHAGADGVRQALHGGAGGALLFLGGGEEGVRRTGGEMGEAGEDGELEVDARGGVAGEGGGGEDAGVDVAAVVVEPRVADGARDGFGIAACGLPVGGHGGGPVEEALVESVGLGEDLRGQRRPVDGSGFEGRGGG